MKLKAIWWYLFNKDKYHTYKILCWIKAAKEDFLNCSHYKGLCSAFICTVPDCLLKGYWTARSYYERIARIIPEYYPEYFGAKLGDDGYWWDRFDEKSRIKALDKLIEVYENKLK